jgi:hypothetical protein
MKKASPPDKYTPVLVLTAVGWLLRYSAGTLTTDNALLCFERTDDERFPTAFPQWKHLPYNQVNEEEP